MNEYQGFKKVHFHLDLGFSTQVKHEMMVSQLILMELVVITCHYSFYHFNLVSHQQFYTCQILELNFK